MNGSEPKIYVSVPTEIEAMQFDGENFDAISEWCGTHKGSDPDWDIPTFSRIGAYLMATDEAADAELWVAANNSWLPIVKGTWILQDAKGFYPCDDDIFRMKYIEQLDAPEPTFSQELASLLNRFSKENNSGTPDYVLAKYLEETIEAFDKAIIWRAMWRSETVEPSALSSRMRALQDAQGD